jgi:hypothetical protein
MKLKGLTHDREVDEKFFEIWQWFQDPLDHSTPGISQADIVYTRHDEFDLVVHCLVKHLCRFMTCKVDVRCQGLERCEVVICQTVECVSLNLSIVF